MKHFFLLSIILLITASATVLGNASKYDASFPSYDLNIKVVPEAHRLESSGTIRIPASGAGRESVSLYLSELMRDFKVEVLQPASSAGLVNLEKKETTSGRVHWVVRPQRPISAGETALLRFSYAGGEQGGFVFYLGEEGSFASGVNTAWYPLLESDNPRGTGSLKFSVPQNYTVIANGKESDPRDKSSQEYFEFQFDKPSYFAFGAGRYTVYKRDGIVPVKAYLLKPNPKINQYLDGCSAILKTLVREFGSYPFGELTIIEAPAEQASKARFNGASVEGGIFVSASFLELPFNAGFYAHEISHQWWGNFLTWRDARYSVYFYESMTNYGALAAVEALEGAQAAEKFRRTGYLGYQPSHSALGYLKLAAIGVDRRLSDLPMGDARTGFISQQLAWSKGFLVLDLLSRTVGRERFRQALRSITRRYPFQAIDWEIFIKSLETSSKTNLDWFFAQWYERTGVPDWKLEWKQTGRKLSGVVTQDAPHYQAAVDIQIEGKNCRALIKRIKIKESPETAFNFPVNCKVENVILDPKLLIPRWTPEYRAEASAFAPHTRADLYRRTGDFAQAQKEFESALKQVPTPDTYGIRFEIEYGLARLAIRENKLKEAEAHLEAALASPSYSKNSLAQVYFELAKIAKKNGDDSKLKRAAESAVKADAANGNVAGMQSQVRKLLESR